GKAQTGRGIAASIAAPLHGIAAAIAAVLAGSSAAARRLLLNRSSRRRAAAACLCCRTSPRDPYPGAPLLTPPTPDSLIPRAIRVPRANLFPSQPRPEGGRGAGPALPVPGSP